MPTLITTRQISIRTRRPKRSANGDKNSAPRTIPARPELKTAPSAAGSRDQSLAISGAANAIAMTSKPSRKLRMMQMVTAAT